VTAREDALCEIIDAALEHIEELGCTCATMEQRNIYHAQAGRRRRDSPCTGVSLAVTLELRRRRVLRRKER
jgi:hypothetical protein